MNVVKLHPEKLESLQQELFARRMSVEADYQRLRHKVNQLTSLFPAIEEHKASKDLVHVIEALNDFMNKTITIETLLHQTASSFKETEDTLGKIDAASLENCK
ncbi:hypothetical protein ABES25_18785 [Bacillus gobiensis]|uniref:hypothetical protein n=1 Tax=Bacillus gobiensis TaxID=1441095 RepID=UPI003D220717